ncbi:HindIII family type II restriction endonuclease [Granulicella mallensis]|uniref:Restriction endonuclease, type II, HindIII n=1 Tax=Granulicella mallensis (strain ATCC BAA-1857 / DSM 23137 / MP5ACTX8) TaxID=682795 RepID=G8NXP2_GRAMM|nr:HindIII family type II restriction endonuclease [Granulicella mallensis]AEU34387.1 Restriction endonuclease, type II, HindIII [Granulicella mallensis MP5ACTX8]
MPTVISEKAIQTRKYWINEIKKLSGDFGADSTRLFSELESELEVSGGQGLRSHLRLCGAIPETYNHDSSEEKLYSKYTDILASLAFTHLGVRSVVLVERGDAADVECFADDYEFVADAKAFRLSRTAKNAKDFKVPSMHKWKYHRQHAMVICPLYQMPSNSSQIYRQAISDDVCILSFSHLSLLTAFAEIASPNEARRLLKQIFKVIATLHPSKDASAYWRAINTTFLDFDDRLKDLWREEKLAFVEALADAKQEALACLSTERSRILRMTHAEAIQALVKFRKLDAREKLIKSFSDNGLMEIA